MAAGAGAADVAVGTAVVTLLVLAGLPPIESFFQRWAHRRTGQSVPKDER
jgi:uncharacterized membrane protein YhiD involved in acid resistance